MSTELTESAAYQLWLATNSWQRMLRRVLDPLGLTHVQYIVLVAIRRVGDKEPHVTQASVCRFGNIDPNMASEVMRSLEKKGFITRSAHPEDGRAVALALTKEGADLSNKARNQIRPLIKEFFAPLGDDQRALAAALKMLNDASSSRT